MCYVVLNVMMFQERLFAIRAHLKWGIRVDKVSYLAIYIVNSYSGLKYIANKASLSVQRNVRIYNTNIITDHNSQFNYQNETRKKKVKIKKGKR